MENALKLFADGKVTIKDGREFTRYIGGFGEDKPCITTKYISDLTGYEVRVINQTIDRNIEHFEEGLHIIDLKKIITDSDHLINMGYSKVAVGRNNSKFYGLSQSGFLLYLKFAEGDRAVELYKDFIEEYFRVKARVEVLEKTLEQELEVLIKERKHTAGELIYSEDEEERFKLSSKRKELDERIENIKVAISTRDKDILIAQYKPKVNKWEQFLDSNGTYSFTEAAKLLSTMASEEKSEINISVGKLTEFLREQGVLNKTKSPDKKKDGVIKKGSYKNLPNKEYEDYFNVVSVDTNAGFNKSQTRVKAKGVEFIYDLVKDKYIAS